MRPGSEDLLQALERGHELLAWDRVVRIPGVVSLAERAVPREGCVQPPVDLSELARVGPRRTDTEASFDLVRPGDLLTGEPVGDASEGFELATQPSPAVSREVGVAETVEEELRLVAEAPRIHCLFGLDRPLHLPGAAERVHEPLEMPAHAQAEPHVSFRDLHGHPG